MTPVLALTGSIVDEGMGVNQVGIRANLKNLSTGREAAAVIADDGAGYQLTIVDIETGQAAQIGDILEISRHISRCVHRCAAVAVYCYG